MKLLLDEDSQGKLVVRLFREAGQEVQTVAEAGLDAHDDAEVFAIRYHDGEWAPFSPRSAAGSQPFPAAYVGHEILDGNDVTLWYVAHVHFDQSFPYTAGPWIRVEGLAK